MDALLDFLEFLCHWRFALSAVIAVVAAVALSSVFAGFTAPYCIALVLIGVACGLVWQGRSDRE